MELLPHG